MRKDTPHGVELRGLDGANPLGFLAALGALRVVALEDPEATLAWDRESLHPAVHWRGGGEGIAALAEATTRVFQALLRGPFSQEHYPSTVIAVGPEPYRRAAMSAIQAAEKTADPLALLAVELFAALAAVIPAADPPFLKSELSFANGQSGKCFFGGTKEDDSGKCKNIQGMRTLAELPRDKLITLLTESLALGCSQPHYPTFRWDPAELRPSAFEAINSANTAKNPVRSIPGANVCALLGLTLLPTVPTSERISTVGFSSSEGERSLTWPLWECRLSIAVVKSLIASITLMVRNHREQLCDFGVFIVFNSKRYTDDRESTYFCPARGV